MTGTVVQVGPVNARGGISSVIHAVLGSGEIQRQFKVVMIGTSLYRDAPAWREVAVSADALLRFGALLLVDRSIVLVHIHSSYGVSFYRKSLFVLLSRVFRVPYVVHVHTGRVSEFLCSGPAVRRWVARSVFSHSARTVLLSSAFEERIREFFPGVRTEVVSNPVTLPPDRWGCSLQKTATAAPRILYVGFLLPAKGVTDLVEAVRKVADGVKVELRLCGKGPLEADLLRTAAQASWLKVVGWVDGEALLDEYAGADVFALPSTVEGVPMALLDAMACGLPCVATKVGGIPSIIEDGVEGYLVDAGDRLALAERLERLAEDPVLRRQMGENAMERAAAHTPSRIACEWIRVYDAVIEATDPRPAASPGRSSPR